MTPKERAVMQQALEALEESCYPRLSAKHTDRYEEAITALQEALSEQAEQDPVAALVAAHEREKRTQELMQLFLDPENQPTQFGTATLEYRESEIAAAYARGHDEGCKDFEALILPSAIASEREACAKVCDEMYDLHEEDWDYCVGLVDCAAAIRARNSHEKTN